MKTSRYTDNQILAILKQAEAGCLMAVTSKLSPDSKAVIWHLWRDGQPMMLIARRVNLAPSAVFSYLRYHGGIQPAVRHRRPNALTYEEREEISRGLSTHHDIRRIARHLQRSPSNDQSGGQTQRRH